MRRIINRTVSVTLEFALLILLGLGTVSAQEGSKSDPRRPLGPDDRSGSLTQTLPFFSPTNPVNCEVAGVYLDDAIRRTKNSGGSYLIVIARLGDGEGSRQLNRGRLNAVEMYMSHHRDVKHVMAEGERVKGYGRVELFVEGKLLYVLPIRKRSKLDLFSCMGI